MSFLSNLFGDPNARVIAELRQEIEKVNQLEQNVAVLTDERLAEQTSLFK